MGQMRSILNSLLIVCAACDDEPKQVPAPPPETVVPGSYVNHIGNPQAGRWDGNGQWQWNDPQSSEASSTMSYLMAAGVGALGGAALSHYMTKQAFEERNPGGWSRSANTRDVKTYIDKRGNPISETEYRRRRLQSERDRARAKAAASKPAPRAVKVKAVSKPSASPRRSSGSTYRPSRSTFKPMRSSGFRGRR